MGHCGGGARAKARRRRAMKRFTKRCARDGTRGGRGTKIARRHEKREAVRKPKRCQDSSGPMGGLRAGLPLRRGRPAAGDRPSEPSNVAGPFSHRHPRTHPRTHAHSRMIQPARAAASARAHTPHTHTETHSRIVQPAVRRAPEACRRQASRPAGPRDGPRGGRGRRRCGGCGRRRRRWRLRWSPLRSCCAYHSHSDYFDRPC